jgi:hypothetical protein
MKQVKTTLYALLGIFGIRFFFGYFFFAIGMGSLFTKLN